MKRMCVFVGATLVYLPWSLGSSYQVLNMEDVSYNICANTLTTTRLRGWPDNFKISYSCNLQSKATYHSEGFVHQDYRYSRLTLLKPAHLFPPFLS